MVSGTLYVYSISPRSSWLPNLAVFCGHTIKTIEPNKDPNFKSIFPLGKAPAFISENGEKVTETIAIIEYFVINSVDEKKVEFVGKNNREKIQNLRWLSFLNTDFIISLTKLVNYTDEAINNEGRALFRKHAIYMNNYLEESKTTFLAANRILAADIFAHEIICRIERAGVGYSQYKNLVTYLEAVKTHEIATK